MKWFDLDRLVQATVSQRNVEDYGVHGLGIVLFHSDKAVGRGKVRLAQTELDDFWGRQAEGEGTSTVLVTVPGHQPEKAVGVCENCKKPVQTEARGEKGVDTSMVTYLYEASGQWERAILFTNDADFVPPILALRRRGKRVYVASIDTPGASALKRACQTFFPISEKFLRLDYELFKMVRPGGQLDAALHAARNTFGKDAWVSCDGTACPVIRFEGEDGSCENAIGDAFGDRASVTWISTNKVREGRILYNSGFRLGAPILRHRGQFQGAEWVELWRD